jgi:hypothetical protein
MAHQTMRMSLAKTNLSDELPTEGASKYTAVTLRDGADECPNYQVHGPNARLILELEALRERRSARPNGTAPSETPHHPERW